MKKLLFALCTTLIVISCSKKNDDKNVKPIKTLLGSWQTTDSSYNAFRGVNDFTIEKINDSLIKLKNFPLANFDYYIRPTIPQDTIMYVASINSLDSRKQIVNMRIKLESSTRFTYSYKYYINSTDNDFYGTASKK